ncbi:MAG: hypothetical protein C4527_10400 [Candidatus Omnitrophota bacterium]|nr:MAG: hypothetical protein C4527_10400 [Candidatus Omnitrophota bacterium]
MTGGENEIANPWVSSETEIDVGGEYNNFHVLGYRMFCGRNGERSLISKEDFGVGYGVVI